MDLGNSKSGLTFWGFEKRNRELGQMLDKPWMWTDSGQSLDLGFALPVANRPPITHPLTIGQILDILDIFWTEFELELCINRALIPNTYQLDKL